MVKYLSGIPRGQTIIILSKREKMAAIQMFEVHENNTQKMS